MKLGEKSAKARALYLSTDMAYKFRHQKGDSKVFRITDAKPVKSEFFVHIDISDWLGTESIASVSYSAKNMATGENVTSTVLDDANNTNTAKVLKPWLQAGLSSASYCVIMKITADGLPSSKGEFYLIFSVNDNLPGIGL